MNNKVNFLRGTSTEYAASTKDNDTFYYTTDTKKLYLGGTEITSIEVDDTSTTATNKTWSAKKISDSIPTTLPANGGNADTVDSKHASDFMQNLGTLTTGSLLDYVLTMTNSGYLLVNSNVTDTPVSGQFFFVDVRRDAGGSYAITATRFNAGGVYTNRYNAGLAKWYGWANVADGGNADTVDNLSAVELVRNLGKVTDATFLNNSEFNEYSYEADIEPTTAEAIGLPAGWYIIKGFRYYGTGKYAVQIAYSRNRANQAMTRYANGTDWTEWRGLGDGCNAATVGGRSITVTDVDPGAGSALNTGEIVFVTEVT